MYGHELSLNINPYEVGNNWVISSRENYIGKENLMKIKEAGIYREIIAVEGVDRGIPRQGYRVFMDNKDIGYITSGVYSPTFKKGIALALVEKNQVKTGDNINIVIRNKNILAKVVERPFYKFNG